MNFFSINIKLNNRLNHFLINSVYLATGIFISLTLIYTHGYEIRGNLAIVQAIAQVCASLGTVGLPSSATYYLKKDKIFTSIFIINFILIMIILLIIFILFSIFFFEPYNINVYRLYLYTFSLALSGFILNGFISLGKSFLIYFLYVLQNLTLITYIFSEKTFDQNKFIDLNISISIFIFIFIFTYYNKFFSFSLKLYNLSDLKYFKYGIKSYPLSIINALTKKLDILIVSYYFNPYNVGFYSLMSNIREFSNFITRVSVNIIAPKLFDKYCDKSYVLKIINYELNILNKINIYLFILSLFGAPILLSFLGNIKGDDIFLFSSILYFIVISFYFNSQSYLYSTAIISFNNHINNIKSSSFGAFVFIIMIFLSSYLESILLVGLSILLSSYINSIIMKHYFKEIN